MKKDLSIAVKLSLVVALLSVIASSGGLIMENLYRDSEAIQAVWFVNDLITLLIAVPLLLVSIRFTLKGSLNASLIWAASLWYMLYNYIFYLYGAVFNAFFLLYVLLFVLSAYSLILTLVRMDVEAVKTRFLDHLPIKAVSTFLFVFAAALGIPWILGILLHQKNPWGVVLAAMILLKGVLYPLVLIIGGLLAFIRVGSWDIFIPLYAVLWLLCLYFYRLLFRASGGTQHYPTGH